MTPPTIRALVLCLGCLSLAAGAASEPDRRAPAEAPRRQHALEGKVYDVALGRLFERPDGSALVPSEALVLLGEVHDNPVHHQVRASLIADAIRARPHWRPAVVFEQIAADQEPALDQFRGLAEHARRPPTVNDLFRLLQWSKSGWPSPEIYKPLLGVVVAGRLPILSGSPPRDRVRAVARSGLSPIDAAERARLRLDDAMPAPLAQAVRRELSDSHCGGMPPQAIGGMAMAQRYRDAYLAGALLSALRRHGAAILIAGNGHVRSDRGVPWHIRQRAPGARVVSVLLVEVEEGRTEPSHYAPRDPEGRPAADMLIFTARTARGDPCQILLKNKQ